MRGCLAKMGREVLLLRFFDELSINEISRTLGEGERTASPHLYRAQRKVRHRAEKIDLELEVRLCKTRHTATSTAISYSRRW
jgi:hypothetical protein